MSLSTVLTHFLESHLDRERGSIPEAMSVSATAALFGVNTSTVRHAIRAGKLEADPVLDADGGVVAYNIPIVGSFGIWGHKITTQSKRDTGRDVSDSEVSADV